MTRIVALTSIVLAATACVSGGSPASSGNGGGGTAGSGGQRVGGGATGGAANQVSGTVRGVDTRNQQITLQQTNGQNLAVGYDNNTRVVYQNQNYAVTNLEFGDQVVARVLNNNGTYYTDSIYVSQPVNGSGTSSTANGNVQSFTGTLRSIDRANGAFSLDMGNNGTVTVTLPYNVSSNDQQRFKNLRSGDTARIYGVWINNTRVELRQFQ